jgi:hypothetical protein
VGTAEEQGDPEALGGAHRDVRALLAGRGDEGQGQQVGGDRDHRPALLGLRDHRGVVDDAPGDPGLLQDHAGDLALGQARRQVGDPHGEAQRLGAGQHHGQGLRQRVGIDDDRPVAAGLVGPAHQQHRLDHRRGLVQQRGVGHRQPGEVGDHGLEVQQRLQAPLGDLGLVGGVGGVPARGLQHVAQDDRGRVGVVVALADHLHGRGVAVREGAQLLEHLLLAEGLRQVQRGALTDVGGHGGVRQVVEAGAAHTGEHGLHGVGAGTDVPVGEDRRRGRGHELDRHEELPGAARQGGVDRFEFLPALSGT